MIVEGMCDVAFEIFNNNGDGQFNEDAYFKAKLSSYVLTVITMGINAFLQSSTVLKYARQVCKKGKLYFRKSGT